jgi:hypothetical protein
MLALALVTVGHLVSALMIFSSQVAGPISRGAKLVSKRVKLTKSDHIVLEGTSRSEFIQHFLAIHGLADVFSLGVHSGPPFKLHWTGSAYVTPFCSVLPVVFIACTHSGGKGGATTIDNDHQFAVAMTALLKKNKDTCQVGVEFDTDEMDGF